MRKAPQSTNAFTGVRLVRRKLTGRSYSALVQPIVRDFPIETIQPGDVFFHNDVYQSEGGIGHLPDLCVTVPVHQDGEVVAFVQAFGHHDDIGGSVPGSMPSHGTSYYQEGLIVPPVRLYTAGEPNSDLMRVMVRNSRLPESLRSQSVTGICSSRLQSVTRAAYAIVASGSGNCRWMDVMWIITPLP